MSRFLKEQEAEKCLSLLGIKVALLKFPGLGNFFF